MAGDDAVGLDYDDFVASARPVRALIDTGAFFNCIQDDFAKRAEFPIIGHEDEQGARRKRYDVAIALPGSVVYRSPLGFLGYTCAPNVLLLGREFLQTWDLRVSFSAGEFELRGLEPALQP